MLTKRLPRTALMGRCLMLGLCLILTSCDPFGIDKLKEESAKWRELAQIQAQAAIRAVPGERYLQLIDDLNSGDTTRVRKAQDFLQRLGHFDPTIDWVDTINFGFNESTPLHADAFFAFSPSRAQVDYFVKNNAFNAGQVANSIQLPQLAGEIDSSINANVDVIVKDMSGNPKIENVNIGSSTLSWPDSIVPNHTGFAVQDLSNKAIQRQQDIANRLKSVLKAQYANKSIPVGGNILEIPWYPTDAKNLLFVVIPEEEWLKHKDDPNWQVVSLLHKKGDASAVLNLTRPMIINKTEFEKNEAVERPHGEGKVRWAAVDPTHSSISIPDVAPDRIASMEKLLEQLNKLSAPAQNPSK
jgi:hypothetical protein